MKQANQIPTSWSQSFVSLFADLSQYRFGNEHRDTITGLWMVRGAREMMWRLGLATLLGTSWNLFHPRGRIGSGRGALYRSERTRATGLWMVRGG